MERFAPVAIQAKGSFFGGKREVGGMEPVEGKWDGERMGVGAYFSKAPCTLISCSIQSILINRI